MKVKLILSSAFAATLIVGSAMWLNIKNEEAKDSALLLENVEALAKPEFGVGNTGPGEKEKCPSCKIYLKFCMCENMHPCIESLCSHYKK